MANKVHTLVLAAACLVASCLTAGCNDQAQNSREQGAIPPKPDPNVMQNVPPSARGDVSAAKDREAQANQQMGEKLKNASQDK